MKATIPQLFNSIAHRYDCTNFVISGMLSAYFYRKYLAMIRAATSPTNLLDIGSGTGKIALSLMQNPLPPYCTLLDISEEMLKIVEMKKKRLQPALQAMISIVHADAEQLPFPNATFDCITAAYLLRNVTNKQKALSEMRRVLQPGCTAILLELSQPKSRVLNVLHKSYLSMVVPIIGKLMTNNKEAYQYLYNSIYSFIDDNTLSSYAYAAGFTSCRITPLCNGIAKIISLR